MLTGTFATID